MEWLTTNTVARLETQPTPKTKTPRIRASRGVGHREVGITGLWNYSVQARDTEAVAEPHMNIAGRTASPAPEVHRAGR